ncbi:MAG: F-box protein [Candidatus Margulisiibacteriota bacterium]|nr:F-box protein [Candidatus Margulisiibacteriota bacterium]
MNFFSNCFKSPLFIIQNQKSLGFDPSNIQKPDLKDKYLSLKIPDDIFRCIFSYFCNTPFDLFNICQVSKRFNGILKNFDGVLHLDRPSVVMIKRIAIKFEKINFDLNLDIKSLCQLESDSYAYNLINFKIIKLDLSFTHIQLLDGIQFLCNLKMLNLEGCKGLKLNTLSNLSSLNGLSVLNLAQTYVDRVKYLPSSQSLKKLNLSATFLSDVRNIEKIPNLTHLNLQICEQILSVKYLERLVNLTHLNLSFCKAVNEIVVLSQLINLESLNLYKCGEISHVDLNGISKLKKLRVLNLGHVKDDVSLKSLAGKTSLKKLSLTQRLVLTDDLYVFISLKNLMFLELLNSKISTDHVLKIVQFSNVKLLSLTYCEERLDDLSFFAASFKNLKQLNLTGTTVSARTIASIELNNPNLKIITD